MDKKVALIVGHEQKRPGAFLNLKNKKIDEWEYNRQVAGLVEKYASGISGIQFKTFFRDGVGIIACAAAASRWGADVIIELHFNSYHEKYVKGAELLVHEQFIDHPFIDSILGKCAKIFNGRSRGALVVNSESRGYRKADLPYFLIEPFFGSNAEQSELAITKMEEYALAIFQSAKDTIC